MVATLYLFVTATSIVGLNIANGHNMFVVYRLVPDATAFLEKESQSKDALINGFLLVTISGIQAISIWGLWVVWSRNWRIAFAPTVLLVVEFVTVIVLCAKLGPRKALDGSPYDGYEAAKVIPNLCRLWVSQICTTLVTGRFWWIARRVGGRQDVRISQKGSLYRAVVSRIFQSCFLVDIFYLWMMFDVLGVVSPEGAILAKYVFQMVLMIAPMRVLSFLSSEVVSQVLNPNGSDLEHPGEDQDAPSQPLDIGAIKMSLPALPSDSKTSGHLLESVLADRVTEGKV
ncbi:hypothetical protein FRB95_014067 [Tulasnella sp. JGI-2019a]|nr:hypothetical protein FRB95_014067 [Tulasnella sp. JGI-2019a]